MQTLSNSYEGTSRVRKSFNPLGFLKQVLTPEDSAGAGEQLRLGLMASATKVTLCVAAAFVIYAMIAQLQ